MACEDGSVSVVLNGEIYDFEARRAELESLRASLPLALRHRDHRARLGGRGRALRGAAERHVRARALGRAAASSCSSRATAWARSRCTTPWRAGRSSSPPSCARSSRTPRSPRGSISEGLARYLAFDYVPDPHSILRDVRKLPPGHVLSAGDERASRCGATGTSRSGPSRRCEEREWLEEIVAARRPGRRAAARERRAGRLLRERRHRLVGGRRHGRPAASRHPHVLGRLRRARGTTSARGRGSSRATSGPRTRSWWSACRCRRRARTPRQPARRAARRHELRAAASPVARRARDGDGGAHRRRRRRAVRRLPHDGGGLVAGRLRTAARRGARAAPSRRGRAAARRGAVPRVRRGHGVPSRRAQPGADRRHPAGAGVASCSAPIVRARLGVFDAYGDVAAALAPCPAGDATARLIYRYCKLYLAGQNLVNSDRASMATGLELRAPFLDHTFVEFMGRIPSSLKLAGFRTLKGLLKRAFVDRLPPEILRRGKQGFGVPFGDWFRGPLAGIVREVLSPDRLRRGGLFDAASVTRLVDGHLRDGARSSQAAVVAARVRAVALGVSRRPRRRLVSRASSPLTSPPGRRRARGDTRRSRERRGRRSRAGTRGAGRTPR